MARLYPKEEKVLSLGQKMERYWNIIRQKLQDRNEDSTKIEAYRKLLEKSQKDERINRALGAIYGAMIGDSLGAYCEFLHHMEDYTVE